MFGCRATVVSPRHEGKKEMKITNIAFLTQPLDSTTPTSLVQCFRHKTQPTCLLLVHRSGDCSSSLNAIVHELFYHTERCNVLLTEGTDFRFVDVLNAFSAKIDTLVVMPGNTWAKLQPKLTFCPRAWFMQSEIDVRRFASYGIVPESATGCS